MIKQDFVNIMNIFLYKFLTQLNFNFCISRTGYKGLTNSIFTPAHMIRILFYETQKSLFNYRRKFKEEKNQDII